jgi:hypothetical protein
MKKQILFTGVIISAFLFSCTKEKIETPDAPATVNEEIAASSSSSERLYIDPLTV